MTDPVRDRATPHLLVDADALETNLATMAAFARDRGVALRPHVKTHKCPDIARLQVDAGATGLTVATVSEAEVFADAGFSDLLVAYPVWADGGQGARLRALAERVDLTVGVDSVEGARALAAQAPAASVLVEVDCGMHRTGVAPDEVADLAETAARAGLTVRGVFTFPGHSYAPGASAAVAAEEGQALRTAIASLPRQSDPPVVSGGSTPSVAAVDADVVTEIRPGVYVFGDAQQWELGTMPPEDIALWCLSTVVSHAGGNVVLDSGSKALGADRPAWTTGFGRLLDYPDARLLLLAEHHAVVSWAGHQPLPALGSRLRVVPNHVCNAVNLADELVVVRNGTVVDTWPVAARGAIT